MNTPLEKKSKFLQINNNKSFIAILTPHFNQEIIEDIIYI